jgi:phosphinothricin acetyltransferase
MMTPIFETMTTEHGTAVIDLFNHYVEHSFAAYPETKLPYEGIALFLKMTRGYPAYVIKDGETGRVIGFCFLRPYHPLPAFRETAEVSYFLAPDAVGLGIGSAALRMLEAGARDMGITRLLASISSQNDHSIDFHQRHGFTECGRFHQIGKKWGQPFDVVWMEKAISGA